MIVLIKFFYHLEIRDALQDYPTHLMDQRLRNLLLENSIGIIRGRRIGKLKNLSVQDIEHSQT